MPRERRKRRAARLKRGRATHPPLALTSDPHLDITDQNMRDGFIRWTCDSSEQFLRDQNPSDERTRAIVTCSGVQGEYAPLIIGLWGLRDVGDVTLGVDAPCGIDIGRVEFQTLPYRDKSYSVPFDIQPENIAEVSKGKNTVFWLTLRIPPMMPAGEYPISIALNMSRTVHCIDVTLDVQPLHLPHADIAFGMFYNTSRFPKNRRHWDYELEYFEDMAEHGHTSAFVGAVNPDPDWEMLWEQVTWREKTGLLHKDIPFILNGYSPIEGETWGQIGERIRRAWLQFEWPEPIIFGPDEVGPGLEQDMPDAALRQYVQNIATMKRGRWKKYGDHFDNWMLVAGTFQQDLIIKAKRKKAKLWAYTCNRCGNNPTFDRFYAGIYTWAYNLSGNFMWAYCDPEQGFSYVVAGEEGPIPTVGWESRREGILDYRILSTLSKLAQESDNSASVEAAKWLSALRERAVWNAKASKVEDNASGYDRAVLALENPCPAIKPGEYATIRQDAINFILEIRSESHG